MSDTPEAAVEGSVTGLPRLWLRAESLLIFLLAVYLYARGGYSWLLFGLLFLAPDLSFLGYTIGPRAGAWIYNIAHSYAAPVLLATLALTTAAPPVAALIWAAHIGFDRTVGYGLKYPSAFSHTHLGRIGRAA